MPIRIPFTQADSSDYRNPIPGYGKVYFGTPSQGSEPNKYLFDTSFAELLTESTMCADNCYSSSYNPSQSSTFEQKAAFDPISVMGE